MSHLWMLLHPVPWNNAPYAIQETTTTEAEARNIEKYRELKDIAYISQSVAMEVEGYLDESSEIFITRLCKKLCRSHDDQPAGSFLKHRISRSFQVSNAACVLGTVSDRGAFEELFCSVFL